MSDLLVLDGARTCAFGFEAMLDYHGGGSPAGVAHAFKVMERAFPLLYEDGPPQRRAVSVRTAFGGPGARDAFELVLRAVTGDRFRVDSSLGRPERGITLERFVFVLSCDNRAATLTVRDRFVPDELIALSRLPERDAEQEERFVEVKRAAAELVMSAAAADVYDATVGTISSPGGCRKTPRLDSRPNPGAYAAFYGPGRPLLDCFDPRFPQVEAQK